MTLSGGGRVRGGVSVDMGWFKNSANWTELIDPLIRPAMEQAVQEGITTATKAVPVRTGRLQSTIGGRVQRRGNQLQGALFVGTDYWQYVEYGTGLRGEGTNPTNTVQSQGYTHGGIDGMPARPFMRPGLIAMQNSFLASVGSKP